MTFQLDTLRSAALCVACVYFRPSRDAGPIHSLLAPATFSLSRLLCVGRCAGWPNFPDCNRDRVRLLRYDRFVRNLCLIVLRLSASMTLTPKQGNFSWTHRDDPARAVDGVEVHAWASGFDAAISGTYDDEKGLHWRLGCLDTMLRRQSRLVGWRWDPCQITSDGLKKRQCILSHALREQALD